MLLRNDHVVMDRKGAFYLKNKIRYYIIKNSEKLKLGLCMVLAACWVGASYPELCFTPRNCQLFERKDGKEVPVEMQDAGDIWNIRSEEVVISSRIWEWLQQVEWR